MEYAGTNICIVNANVIAHPNNTKKAVGQNDVRLPMNPTLGRNRYGTCREMPDM